jgi:C1A family cysteine protease/PKD repeat protein
MINQGLARLAVLASIALLVACPATILADDQVNPPTQDSVDLFQPPGVYPLISEDAVTIHQIIKPSAYDLTPDKTKRDIPIRFDLRSVEGHNYVTPVKNQSGGTCWTHGTMASIESHTLMSGIPWIAYLPAQTYPCMDEYHLDWWNGFNQHYNADIYPITGEGLEVHMGGDYLVSAAYFARNDGAVDRYLTSGSLYTGTYSSPAVYMNPNYDYYFPREIEWLTAGTELENINAIKEALQTYGIVATAICWSSSFYNSSTGTFYQPPASTILPNHSVAIAGWNDTLTTQAPQRGAWLCKNSWSASWGQAGYFWVSYYDKVAGHHPEMGAVTFHDVEITGYRRVYYHDYHGWRDTRDNCYQVVNAFKVDSERMISDASFISAADNVDYLLQVYDNFDPATGPSVLLASAQGTAVHIGLHTVALNHQVRLPQGDDFYVSLTLSGGGMAFDRTSLIPVLLGGAEDDAVLVRSTSAPGESYYYEDAGWHDLYAVDTTASFCVKALADKSSPVGVTNPIGTAPLSVTFSADWLYGDVLGCQWEFDDGTGSTLMSPTHTFSEPGLHNVTVSLTTYDGEVTCLHKNAFAVQADTMTVSTVVVDAGASVKVDINLHNYLPINLMVIPFTWEGPLNLSFDSISVAGCRTEGLGSISLIDPVPPSRTATVTWETDQTTWLEAGLGPVVSLYFTVSGGSANEVNLVRIAGYGVYEPNLYCVGLADYQPTLVDGHILLDCCVGRVGDANLSGEDVPTIGDVSVMIDAKYITGTCDGILNCLFEADVNQSGGTNPTCNDITIGDISTLIDYLFITGPSKILLNCH